MQSNGVFQAGVSIVSPLAHVSTYTGAINHILLKSFFAWPPCGYLVNKQIIITHLYEPGTLISLSKHLCFL